MDQNIPFYDVVIIGAGLSGIGAAYHLQDKCPGRSYTILEARADMGGTWDLFKYPGIRSDSDMFTLGFSFHPWKNPKSIADGPSILSYIKETAQVYGIDKHIQYNHEVMDADWSSQEQQWTLTMAAHEEIPSQTIKCNFLFSCTGYYNYDEGHNPKFPGSENFRGRIIHPQHWDESLDYTNKKVVVIGSGATAVTLVPEMSKLAEKVTMLQRSPTYIMNLPSEDPVANGLRKILPAKMAHTLSRWKNILISMWFFNASQRWPDRIKKFMQKQAKKALGNKYEEKHFNPRYKPWDQRFCLVPDNDFFDAMVEEKVEIVTDTIKTFTEKGILLDSGKELEADVIVTATGLKLLMLGGVQGKVDGVLQKVNEAHVYRGVMVSDIPNFAFAVGYTNASWTLKCDLNCEYVAKLLNHMDDKGHKVVVPRFDSSEFQTEPLLDLTSGYVARSQDILPKQGSKKPWKIHQNYIRDLFLLRYGSVKDKYLEYQ